MSGELPRQQNIRSAFASTGGETLRAYVLFSLLLLVLVGIVAQLAFRDLSLKVLAERLDLGQIEARRIARAVEQLGREGAGIDFSRIRERGPTLERYIGDRIARRLFISYVEVRDRFGVRQLLVVREEGGRTGPIRPPGEWPAAPQVVSVPLRDAEGEIRLGVSPGPLVEELAALRNALRWKLAAGAAGALAVLLIGAFYVVHLLRKNQRLEQARQSADRASYAGLLASNLAHEIRNPLNAMMLNVEMLEEELAAAPAFAGGEQAELLDSTKREIERLERLVSNFLSYTRPTQPRFESRDLNAIVADVLVLLEGDFRQAHVEVHADLAQLLPTVEVDETLFKQALINVLINARQVLRERTDGVVWVRTRVGPGGEAVIEVQDNGPGVPADVRERIFDMFFSRRGGGTGLGLPIARQNIQMHGGTIEVESVEGHGATFRMRIPRRHGGATERPR